MDKGEKGRKGVSRPHAGRRHCSTCPPRLPTIYFFQFTLELYKSDSGFCAVASPYVFDSASAAAVVQSQLHEPCSLYYFVSLCMRQN